MNAQPAQSMVTGNAQSRSPMMVKLCGITSKAAIDAACSGDRMVQPSHLGFVFLEASPRFVALDQAAMLAQYARGRASRVGLFVDPDDQNLEQVLGQVELDMIQLHGHESNARIASIRQHYAKPVIKAISVANAASLAKAHEACKVADFLLLDSPPPAGASRPGGHGTGFDLALLREHRFAIPWFLAGGLNPDNVRAAIQQARPDGVDASSGLEDQPGHKSPAKIRSFLDAVYHV